MTKKSKVWKYFAVKNEDLGQSDKDKHYVKCRFCTKTVYKNATRLWKHLQECEKSPKEIKEREKSQVMFYHLFTKLLNLVVFLFINLYFFVFCTVKSKNVQ